MLERSSHAYPKTSNRPESEPSEKSKRKGFALRFTPGLHLWLVVPLLLVMFVARDALGLYLTPRAPLTCQADTLLVMGAAQYNGTPSPAFARRLDRALELYQDGCASDVVVTGGKQAGDVFSEGASGVAYLAARGISTDNLRSETTSTTSYQNLANSRSLIKGQNLTIVTDDFHAYRTHWLAERLGYTPELATVSSGAPLRRWLRELVILSAYHLGVIR